METDLPPDMLPKAEPKRPTPPSPAEQQEAWHLVERLWQGTDQDTRTHQYLAGAVAAARWTSQWTAEPPLTRELKVASPAAMTWEGCEAALAAIGKRPGVNVSYSQGASAWLDWLTGLSGRPHWLH